MSFQEKSLDKIYHKVDKKWLNLLSKIPIANFKL